ncbi:MAG TPA: hypothetical protein VN179_00370 [Solirubrobacterales bacterium]|nr:hypothetical protein [Solirubrobacterales bacterium]
MGNGKRNFVAAAVTVMVLGVVGLVYAAWTTNGSGSGYAKAGSSQALTTVDVSASTTATLYPGATGDVILKVSNPNSYPVRVTDVTGSGTITVDSGHAAGCVTTGVTFTNQTGQTIDIAANSQTQVTLTGAAKMSNASDNGCQGATFTIPVTLTGASNAS